MNEYIHGEHSRNFKYLGNTLVLLMLLMNLLPFQALASKSDFAPGYIVTLEKDTIEGFIEIKDHAFNARNCVFKATINAAPIIYSPQQLEAYGIRGKMYFRSFTTPILSTENRKVFLECIVRGKVSLFFLNDSFFIEHDSSIEQLIEINEEINQVGKSFNRSRPVFKSTLQGAMSDCKTIHQDIATVELTRKSLIRLILKYNSCQGINANIFDANTDKMAIRFGLSASAMYSHLKFASGGSSDFSFIDRTAIPPNTSFVPSAWIEIWRPGISSKFRWQTGLNYYSSTYKGAYESNAIGLRYEFTLSNSRIELPIKLKYLISNDNNGFYLTVGIGLNKFTAWKDEVVVKVVPSYSFLRSHSSLENKSFFIQFIAGVGMELPLKDRSVFIEGNIGMTEGILTPKSNSPEANISAFIVTVGFPLNKNK